MDPDWYYDANEAYEKQEMKKKLNKEEKKRKSMEQEKIK